MSVGTGKEDELLFWIALRLVAGVGNVFYKRLIAAFGTPERVFAAPFEELVQVEGIPQAVADRIRHSADFGAAGEVLAQIRKEGAGVITLTDPRYPVLLKQINDPPPFLYTKGRPETLSAGPCVALVGTRFPSPYGEEVTAEIALALVSQGFTIVSGMAKGIDAIAHRTALEHRGSTIAVWGTGIDRVYPAENRQLAHGLADNGLILSEYPPGTPPLDMNFPERNRIISGLSLAVIVTEASLNSGTMITVSHALDQGRDVFAVPGQIYSMMSQGTNRLIKHGCAMVDTVDSLITEIRALVPKQEGGEPPVTQEHADLLSLLSPEPMDLDTLIAQSKFDTAKVMSMLTEMEIRGVVKQLPGKRFVKME